MKVIIIGAYGCGNKGDDAILESFYNFFSKTFKIIPFCGQYGMIDCIIGEEVTPIKCRLNEGFSLPVLFNIISMIPKYIYHLLSANAVFIGGGSLIHDLTRYNLPFFLLMTKLALLFKKKVYFVGVGAGPLSTKLGKKLCSLMLNKVDGIYIRDPFDGELLKKIGIKKVNISADLAFAVDTDLTASVNILNRYGLKKKEYIVVTICAWFKSSNFYDRTRMNFFEEKKILKDAIQNIIQRYTKKVIFLPTVFHDYALGKELESKINSKNFIVIDHRYNCKEMASVISNAYFLFGMRMHSIIFAIRAHVPFVSIIYDEKVLHLLKRLKLTENVTTYDDLLNENFLNKIEMILNKNNRYDTSLLIHIKELVLYHLSIIENEILK